MGKKYQIGSISLKQEIETIWEQDDAHNQAAPWIQQEYEKMDNINRMEWKNIEESEVKAAVGKTANWKSPGTVC